MSKKTNKSVRREWTCDVSSDIVSVAVSMQSKNTFVATAQGGLLINDRGDIVNEVRVEGLIETAGVSDDGRCFGVLTVKGDLYGFTDEGEPLWKLDVEGVSDFDLGRSGKKVALAVPPYSVLVAETGNPDSNVDLTFQHKVDTLALVEDEESAGVVAAGRLGELSRTNIDGEVTWKVNAGLENGPMGMSHAAQQVAVAVYDEGFEAYSLGGEEVGSVSLKGGVTAVLPALGPSSPLYCALVGENRLLVVDKDGEHVCERDFETLVVDHDFCDDASLLVAGGDDHRVYGFGMPAGEVTWMLEGGVEAELSGTDGEREVEKPKRKREQNRAHSESGVPRPKRAELVGQANLEEGKCPAELDELFITPDGSFSVSVVSDGAIVLDEKGNVSQSIASESPLCIAAKRNSKRVLLWSEEEFTWVDLCAGTSETASFDGRARLVDCTADGKIISMISDEDELVILRSGGEERCRRTISPPPRQLFVSPGGSTILTKDVEGRFRFFDNRGEQQRKQRISGQSDYNQIILEEGFCALGGTNGRIIVHEMSGKVLWTKRVAKRIDRMESLKNSIAVYSHEGICMVLNPYGEIELEFDPPPGLSKLRAPANNEPLLVHARRRMLTAYEGYSRKLKATWSFRCEEPIRVFDVDQNARRVVIAAGERLYSVKRPEKD